MAHIPVLLNEVLETLAPKPGQNFIDATINGGGHATAILERINPTGKLIGIEWDRKIFEQLERRIKKEEIKNLILINDSYANIENIMIDNHFQQVNGILFDLGMSNWHLEESGKGFSFLRDEPLDMRYDTQTNQLSAIEIVNEYDQTKLEKIIREFGEESFARSISEAIIKSRKSKQIVTTVQLVEVIKNAVPFWYRQRRIHFATKTFQALRIAVNHELENVDRGIRKAIEIVPSRCRIAVITFHSLEDRIVKNLFREFTKSGTAVLLNKKPIATSYTERVRNPKSRSAKLRVIIKI